MRFVLFPLILLSAKLEARSLWLKIGESQSLTASPEALIRVGTRGIIRVVENGDRIQVIGLKPGFTAMTVDRSSYMVHVVRSAEFSFLEGMKLEIERMKGLKLATDVQPLEVHGTLLRFKDWQRLSDHARRTGGVYAFKARALPDVAEEAIQTFKRMATRHALPVLRFSADPWFTVHVPKGPKSLRQSASEVFASFGLRVLESDGQILVQPLVHTRVILAEINRAHGRTIGVEWPSTYQAQLLSENSPPEGLPLVLKALEAKGQAQILASPTLTCRSGGEAHFHAGGEFPIRVASRQSRDVVWRKHGVQLKVRPRADFTGALSMEVETEISLLDAAHSVDGIPALKSNTVKSQFDLTGRRTIALSGLVRQDFGYAYEGLPFLSSLPVLGALFSSRQFRKEQSELVVFVTPEIQPANEGKPIEMPKGWVTNEW